MCSCSWSHHRSERSASHSVTLPRAAQTPARPRTVLESFLALIISRFSGEENGRADQRPCAKALKGNVGVDEGESGRDRLNPSLLYNLEKTPPVVAGEICNRGDRTFAPKISIRERRDVAHVDTGAADTHALTAGAERRRAQHADRRAANRVIEPS